MTWPPADARELGDANEIDVVVPAPGRDDVRTPIWIVAVDGDLYVRSWKGENGHWYRRARKYGTGSVIVNEREHPVPFTAAGEPRLEPRIDDAYQAKYGRSSYTAAMTRPPATSTTLRLDQA
jgi:hypothetical protein